MDVYRAACLKKAHIYYDQEKYAQAKSLDLNHYSQKHNKEYVFPDTIESERIKYVVKYFLTHLCNDVLEQLKISHVFL
jgi:hypothetical protein